MGQKKKKNTTEVIPGPASSMYKQPVTQAPPELPIKKYRYYCEACSHSSNITDEQIANQSDIVCANCSRVNKFASKNILPI